MKPHAFGCSSVGRAAAAALLLSALADPASAVTATSDTAAFDPNILLPPGPVLPNGPEAPSPAEHIFSLRQIYHHGTYKYPRLHRRRHVDHDESRIYLAAEDGYGEVDLPKLKVKSRPMTIQRLADRRPEVVDPLVAQSRQLGFAAAMDVDAWTMDSVSSPDITDRDTVLNMAYMAANAYVENEDKADWQDIDDIDRRLDFGWDNDGLRGHIWADESNSTIVIGLKGTSPAVFDGEGTTTNDKVNDNLFFSCCCAQQGQWTWHQVCDCATGTYMCNTTCVAGALREENRYYAAARALYGEVIQMYPESNVWVTGHSLGGAVTSLLGLTYGLPAVTFEAVPEALAASRLGLPVPPGYNNQNHQARMHTGSYHFGHTADPIYIGTCNGATASCSFAGYALETACHTGYECVYDVVADKGWRVGIGTHKIRAVIADVLLKYQTVPKCEMTPECRDCAQWKMYESNGTETTTSAPPKTSTRTRTRTETCQTPGWFGCMDETTTTRPVPTTTTTKATTTCHTPGWFGCKDKTITTLFTTTQPSSTAVITTTASPSTTCQTPGRFWGCNDKTTSPTTTQPVTTSVPTTIPSSTTCKTPGRFWGCNDETTDINTSVPTTTTSSTTCQTPGRIWGCNDKTTTTTSSDMIITSPPTGPVPTSPAPTTTTTTPRKCIQRSWLGYCKKYEGDETASDYMDEV